MRRHNLIAGIGFTGLESVSITMQQRC